MQRLTTMAAGSLAAAFFFSSVAADEVVISGEPFVQDTTLYENNPTTNGGGWQALASGYTLSGSPRRSLIRFDLFQIPFGSTITSARLDLHLEIAASRGVEETTLSLHRVTAPWVEGTGLDGSPPAGGGGMGDVLQGTACWNDAALGTTPWATAGGDFVTTPSASTLVPNFVDIDYTWDGEDVTADVQAMRDGTVPNYGWILVEELDVFGSGRAFLSSEAAAEFGPGPRLTVEFDPPPSSENHWMLN